MITILIIVVLVVVFIIACLLMVPFHIILNLENQGLEFKGIMQIKWMKIGIIKREIPSETPEEEKEEKKEEKGEAAKWNLDKIVKVFNLFLESLPHFERILVALYRSIDLERFWLNLRVGLDSPVDTAMIAGVFWSMNSIINTIPRVTVTLNPQFMKPVFEGKVEIEFKIRLLWIVAESIRAVTKKPVRNLIREVRA
ncbi:hypothetical protein Metbo_1935 [Methanobacterium lacus]|uniref:DUF2953 domain-containing protein n=1 Tax=Methanobacterium lacus (strain AL-21) TaxID=877455 RepID=F0TB09_METLA|nr:DUF2953 domain-containing protein [Methanobacterium lacus]ADZ10155.1 hypothetical protein Metbo_1935 [Methanobacterium lacus]